MRPTITRPTGQPNVEKLFSSIVFAETAYTSKSAGGLEISIEKS